MRIKDTFQKLKKAFDYTSKPSLPRKLRGVGYTRKDRTISKARVKMAKESRRRNRK
jgi:hypothetical protein